MLHWIEEHILVPTVHAMKRSRRPFRGVLYAGLMMTNQGPKVLEFNVRFGDPECQPLLMRLKTDLLDVLEATVEGRLGAVRRRWSGTLGRRSAWSWPAEGYPGSYPKGHPIRGLDEADAAARREGLPRRHGAGRPRPGGYRRRPRAGRDRPGRRPSPRPSCNAYRAVKCIRWPGAWCRKDISDKAMGKG